MQLAPQATAPVARPEQEEVLPPVLVGAGALAVKPDKAFRVSAILAQLLRAGTRHGGVILTPASLTFGVGQRHNQCSLNDTRATPPRPHGRMDTQSSIREYTSPVSAVYESAA